MPEPKLRIALSARSESRELLIAVARRLRAKHDAVVHLYCYSQQELDYYNDANTDNVFASITVVSLLTSLCFETGLEEETTVARAAEWEKRLGATMNRLAVSDRHFGRGFALGGPYHPRSRYSEKTSYIQFLHAYCGVLDFWLEQFQIKSIDLVMNGTKEAAFVSRYLRIPFRSLAGSRYENYHYWAENELYENSAFESRYNELTGPSEISFDRPYFGHRANRKRLANIFSFKTMIRGVARTLLQYGYWRLRGYEKAKGYYCRENALYFYRVWTQYRQHRRFATTRLKDIEGRTFVYFPLHIEPETALHGISPEYFYQHAAIAAVARDLPAGVMLVVKEAYGGIGRRPSEFYRQVADLKNVIWLDCWESGMSCAQAASATVTICGTAGLEAACAGRPVISFGHHNIYNFLPSVRVVEDERLLATYLREALQNPDRGPIRNDAMKLVQAVVDCSVDLEDYDYVNLANFSENSVERLCDALLASIASDGDYQEIRLSR